MKIGDKIIWCSDSNFDDMTNIREGIITRLKNRDLVWVDNHHAAEDCILWDYVWPAEAREEIETIMIERGKLRQAYESSMKLVYTLVNKYSESRS